MAELHGEKLTSHRIQFCRFFPICTLSISSRVNRSPDRSYILVVAGLVCPAIRCAISMVPPEFMYSVTPVARKL